MCVMRATEYLTPTFDWISLKEYTHISVHPAIFFRSILCVDILQMQDFYPYSIIMHPHTPGATYQWEAHSKKSTIQTARSTNTAHSFLRSRKSSKSVWSCVFAPRLPPGGTPLIKPTDCILYRGELPQTGSYCKRRLSVCVCEWRGKSETVRQIKLRHKEKHLRQENIHVCILNYSL